MIEKIKADQPFIIGETGFGAGRILVALIDLLDNSGLEDLNIIYNSVELHPLTSERVSIMLDGFKSKYGKLIDQFVEEYNNIDINKKGWNKLVIKKSFGTITLNLWIGEAIEMLKSLNVICDTWFLDGHNPKKNPEIWRYELLKIICEKTKIGGTCASFTVSPNVINYLSQSGFKVEKYPGLAWKKSVLLGVKI